MIPGQISDSGCKNCGSCRMASLSAKALTAEIEAMLSEKNAGYTEYQEKKRRVNELLTIKRRIDQVLHGVPRQQRDEHDRITPSSPFLAMLSKTPPTPPQKILRLLCCHLAPGDGARVTGLQRGVNEGLFNININLLLCML